MSTNLAAKLSRWPQHTFWEITDACNLRCIHCEADSGTRDPDELTLREMLALAEELVEAGCTSVNLTGGEPLLRKDWPALASRLTELGVAVTVITNGLLVDGDSIQQMLDCGVKGVSVSLDGDRDVHDTIRISPSRNAPSSYDATIRAIERLTASPLKTAVITQVHRHNTGDLGRMHDQLAGLGIDAWQVQIAMPLGRLLKIRYEYLIEPRQIPALIQQLVGFIEAGRIQIAVADNIGYYGQHEPVIRGSMIHRKTFWSGCLAGCRVLGICSNGDIKGCPSHPRPFVVGNVREIPFAELWGDDHRWAYNTEWDETKLEGECARCTYRRVCRAGCTSMSFGVTGTIYDNPFCLQRATERAPQRR